MHLVPRLWWAWIAFVVYGSLLPFDFQHRPLEAALEAFRTIPFLALGIESRADWVANGVLYMPVGLLGMLALSGPGAKRPLPRLVAALVVLGVGALLAVGIEFTQLFAPPRTVSQNDLIAELIGTTLGVAVGPWLAPWAQRLIQALQQRRPQLGAHLLELYAGAYLLLALFPFDPLLDAHEWSDKLASNLCGWWLAGANLERGATAGVLLVVEALLAAPLGLWLAGRRRQPGSPIALAVVAGLLLGMLLEVAQLAIASGVSQGLSVLARGLGCGMGAWLLVRWRLRDPTRWRDGLGPWLAAGLLGYLGLLAAVNGLLSHPVKDSTALATQWAELRLLPFYYHYYTTEAEAAFSLGSVALMYLPLVVLGWLRRWPDRQVLVLVALLVGLVELAKFMLASLRPDPTNILIALMSCTLAQVLLRWLESRNDDAPLPSALSPADRAAHGQDATDVALHPDPTLSTAAYVPRSMVAAGALTLALVTTLTLPRHAALATAVLVVAGALSVWRPRLALVLLPAAWFGWDMTPWTGRLYWGELDALALLLWAVALWRTPPPAPGAWRLSPWWWCLVATLVVSGLRGVWSPAVLDAQALVGLYGPLAGPRLLRGVLWAMLLLWLARRLVPTATEATAWLASGVAGGTLLVVGSVLWERLAFPGLWDLNSIYRVTGTFSAMHTGGAYVEAHLVAGAAALGWLAWQAPVTALRWGSALALVPTTYAVVITYSRNAHAALAVAALVMLAAVLRHPGARPAVRMGAGALVLMIGAVAWPVLTGGFASHRLASSAQDLAIRVAHWQDALALRQSGTMATLVGEGLGSYPAAHFWRSAEAVHAASFGLVRTDKDTALRLAPGAPVYIEQLVPVRAGEPLQLTLQWRSQGAARLGVAVCEKWLLTSAACAHAALVAERVTSDWQTHTLALTDPAWQASARSGWRTVKLAVFHGGGAGTLDLRGLQLNRPGDPTPLLNNGDWAQGMDHWFFSTDIDPPWHVHNTPVQLLLESGVIGLLAWASAWLVALVRSGRRSWAGQTTAAWPLAALAGLTVCGALNTLTDDPRLLAMLLLLLGLACGPKVAAPGLDISGNGRQRGTAALRPSH